MLRLLRGEELDTLSRELGVTAARLAQWRDDFLAAGEASLKTRKPDPVEEETLRLKAKVGDLMMRNELYEMAFDKLGVPIPFGARRLSKWARSARSPPGSPTG